jgi:hypothetical protein
LIGGDSGRVWVSDEADAADGAAWGKVVEDTGLEVGLPVGEGQRGNPARGNEQNACQVTLNSEREGLAKEGHNRILEVPVDLKPDADSVIRTAQAVLFDHVYKKKKGVSI